MRHTNAMPTTFDPAHLEGDVLLAAMKSGDREAIEFFAHAAGRRLRMLLGRSGLSREDVEDLILETVERALSRIDGCHTCSLALVLPTRVELPELVAAEAPTGSRVLAGRAGPCE